MSIADDLVKLQGLRESGAINDAEFEAAKARLLAGDTPAGHRDAEAAPNTDLLEQQLSEIRRQNEVATIDREWELNRENFMVRGQHGHRYIPTRGTSVIGGVVIVGFGIFWLSAVFSMGGPGGGGFAFFGVLFILFGLGMSVNSFIKADAYESAQRRYRARRQQLLEDRSDD